jgi:hypothetical protein
LTHYQKNPKNQKTKKKAPPPLNLTTARFTP